MTAEMPAYETVREPDQAPLADAKPCPFCGCNNLSLTLWCDDDGAFDAIECDSCKASAPATTWNDRNERTID